MFIVPEDPLSGGTGELDQTFYIGIGINQIEFNPNLLEQRDIKLICA